MVTNHDFFRCKGLVSMAHNIATKMIDGRNPPPAELIGTVYQQVSFTSSTVGIIILNFDSLCHSEALLNYCPNQDFHEFWRRSSSLGRGMPGSRRTSRMRLSHVAKKGGRCSELVCLRSWQQVFWVVVSNIFLFSPLFGEDFQFDEYFSKGLKPPTSRVL